MPKKRSRAGFSWKQEIGGVPAWGILVAVVAIAGMLAVPAVVNATTPAAAPYVRPSDAFDEPVAQEIPRAVAWGDSWFNGADGIPPEESFGYLALTELGFKATVGGHGGTGYVNAEPVEGGAPNYVEQIAAGGFPTQGAQAGDVQLVVLEGGLNDFSQDASAVRANALSVIASAKAQYPNARIVVLGPPALGDDPEQIAAVTDAIRSAASEAGVDFIDMGPWVTPENVDSIIGDVSSHPDREGFQALAAMLASALTELGVEPSLTP